MAKNIDVEIGANTSGFISSLNSAERALTKAVNAMKGQISSLNSAVGSLNTTFSSVSTHTASMMASMSSMGGASGASGAQINALNANLGTLIQRLSANTSALHHSYIAMGHLTTSTSAATTAMGAMASAGSHAGAGAGAAGAGASGASAGFTTLAGSIANVVKGMGAMYVANQSLQLFNESKDAVIDAEKAFKSFESSVNATGTSLGALNPIIEKYAKTTSLTRSEIMQSMSSMMKMKFTPEQMDKALGSATDLAAFGAQKGKAYGAAIVEGFEGLRMGISNNTNNMGWQENIAKAEEKYAAAIGKTTEQLTQQEKAQAYVVSMAREAAYAAGDAAKSQSTLAGALAESNKQMQESKEVIGQALTPTFIALSEAVAGFYQWLGLAVNGLQITTIKVLGYFEKLGLEIRKITSGDIKGLIKELDAVDKRVNEQIASISNAKGYQNTVQKGGKIVDDKKELDPKEKYEKAKEAYDLMMAKAVEDQKAKKVQYDLDLDNLKKQLKDKLISLAEFQKQADKINDGFGASIQTFLDNKITGLKTMLGYGAKDPQTNVAIIQAEGEKKTEALKATRTKLTFNSGRTGGGGGSTASSAVDIERAEADKARQLRENAFNLFKAQNSSQIALTAYKFQTFKTSASEYYDEVRKLENEEYKRKIENINADIKSLEKEKSSAKNKVDAIRIEKELKNATNSLSMELISHTSRIEEANRAQEKYNQNLQKTKDLNAISNGKEDLLKDIQLAQIENEKKTLGGAIKGKEDPFKFQKDIEQAKFDVASIYIQEKMKYILENESENQQELIALDNELTALKRDNVIKMAELDKQQLIAKKQDYISLQNTYKEAGAQFLVSTAKDASSISKNWKTLGDQIENQLMSIASKNIMEKIFNIDAVSKFFDAFASNSTGAGTGSGILSSIGSGISGMMDGGSGGGGSLFSGLGSLFSLFTPLATGTNHVPRDMPAILHEGEAVLPKKFNSDDFLSNRKGNTTVVNNFNSNAVPNKITQHQMAMSSGNSVKQAMARK